MDSTRKSGTPPLDIRRAAAQECAAIEADLERLKALFNDAADQLLSSFHEVAQLEAQTERGGEESARVAGALSKAVTALQFQDLATQLAGHAQSRLLSLESCLLKLCGETGEGPSLESRPQPVGQAEMKAGNVELF
jgi:hypothetical protein